MSDTLREAAQLLAVELTVEIANAPAPNYEEDDYAAGYVAGLAFALEKLDTILAAHPADTETVTEWGVAYFDGDSMRVDWGYAENPTSRIDADGDFDLGVGNWVQPVRVFTRLSSPINTVWEVSK